MVSEKDIKTVHGKIARYAQRGEPVPSRLATCLAGYALAAGGMGL